MHQALTGIAVAFGMVLCLPVVFGLWILWQEHRRLKMARRAQESARHALNEALKPPPYRRPD